MNATTWTPTKLTLSAWRIEGGSNECSNAEWYHDVAFDSRLGLRWCPAGLGRGPDAAECAEAVPVASGEPGEIGGALLHESGERLGRFRRLNALTEQFQFFADPACQVGLAAAHQLLGLPYRLRR